MEYVYTIQTNQIDRRNVKFIILRECLRTGTTLLIKLVVFYIMYVWFELYREIKLNI